MATTTLKDIANATGVSTTTVSIILNNKAKHISKDTKELVLKTAKKMNYRPNMIARSLVKQSSHSIGLIMPDIVNPFFAEIAKGVYEVAMKNNYTVSIFNTDDNIDKDIECIDYMIDTFVDGFVSILATDSRIEKMDTCAKKLENCSCPIVLIDRLIDGQDFMSVTTDNKQGGFLATEHLIKLGHTRIGCVCSQLNTNFSKQRFYGYLEALQKYNIKFDSELIYEGDFRFETGHRGANVLIKKGVTAIFAFNDMIAYGVYRLLKEQDLKVPKDISVVGYDDLLYSSMLSIPLTTINQPARDIGRKSAEKLISCIEGKAKDINTHDIFTPELVIRESTSKLCIKP